jgi:hypothetical protein
MASRRTGGIALGPFGPWPMVLPMLPMLVMVTGCSSTERRDQNYGKDAGLIYEPREAGVADARDARDGGADAADDAAQATTDGDHGDGEDAATADAP